MEKIYPIVFSILLLVVIAGCRQGSPGGPVSVPGAAATTVIPQSPPGIYTLRIDDSISVNNKLIQIRDISTANGIVMVSVDDEVLELETTRSPKIARGIEIESQRVDYGPTPRDHTVTIKVSLFKLGPNEYLISTGETILVAGNEIKFIDLTTVDGARLRVNAQNEILIDLGKSKTTFNIQITNKRAFDNPIRSKRFALLEVKEISS